MTELKFDLNDFKMDKAAIKAGVWIDMGGGARFKLASFDSPEFTDAFRKATKPYTDLSKEVPEKDQETIMCRTMATHILLDWENVFDGDEPLPYSTEEAFRVLLELERVRTRVITEAQKLDNFKAAAREATEGN